MTESTPVVLALPHGTVRHREEPDEPHGQPVTATDRDLYLGRNDVAGAKLKRPWGWPLRPARLELLVGAAEAAGLPSGLDDMASSASNFVPGPSPGHASLGAAGLRSAARQTARVPGTQATKPPAAASVAALSAAGAGLLVYSTWVCIKDFRDARKSLKESGPERVTIQTTLDAMRAETSTVLQRDLIRQAETLLRVNTQRRRQDITMLLFPGALGTLGSVVGGLSFLFYPNLFGAFIPGVAASVLPLLYVATPLTFVFTAAEGVLRARDCAHALHMARSAHWLLEHSLVGNELEVHDLLQERLRRQRLWSGVSAAAYFGAAIGGPLSLGAPTAGLVILLASAVGILVSDNVLDHAVNYEPQLDIQERLAYANPHSLVNAVEETHDMLESLTRLQRRRGRGWATLLGAHHGFRWHVARAWQHCLGPADPGPSWDAMHEVIESFMIAELQRVRNEEIVLQDYQRQAFDDAETLEDLGERRALLQCKEQALCADINDLADNMAQGPEAAVFWLLRFLTRDNLFKPLAMEVFADPALSALLTNRGLFQNEAGEQDLDANELVLALSNGGAWDAVTGAWVVQRLYELAERVMLTVGAHRARHLEREMLDMLGERLISEAAAVPIEEGEEGEEGEEDA